MKSMVFRYNDNLIDDIKIIASIDSYSSSRNLVVVHAVKIAAAYVRKIQKQKNVKEPIDAKWKIQDNLKIELPYVNDLQSEEEL